MTEGRPTLRDEGAQSRYRRISTRMWNDRKFRELTQDGQFLFFYLLTNPETSGVPGLFRAREVALAADLGWSPKRFRGAFSDVSAKRMALADWKAGLVWLPNALKHDPPANPNVVVSWGRTVRNDMPECALLLRALTQMRGQLQNLFENPDWALKAFDKAFPEPFLKGLAEAFPEPFPEGLPKAGFPTPDAGSPTPDSTTGVPESVAAGDEFPPTADGGWAFIQHMREQKGLAVELKRPTDFDGWHARALAKVGIQGVSTAICRYFADDHFATRDWATAVLITDGVWPQRASPPPRKARHL